MVFGTFDHFHKGHEYLLKKARALAKNSFLIVSVARDVNVKRIKGKKPDNSELKRAGVLRKSGLADKVVLGSKTNYLARILKEKPDIIALGYDQLAYTQSLKEKLEEKGLKVKVTRIKSFKPHLYKSSIVRKLKT